MTEQELRAKLEELKGNGEFTEKVNKAESYEELADLFSEEGLEVTAEEISDFANEIKTFEGELKEDDLESVAGGSLSVIVGIGATLISGVWATLPGETGHDKAQFVFDWWYNTINGARKRKKKSTKKRK